MLIIRHQAAHYVAANKVFWSQLLLLLLALLLAVSLGAINIPLAELSRAVVGAEQASQSSLIITHIRLPRALLAALVGALLGISGAVTQGLFRNALADPSLIGVTAGAVLGASLAIVFAGTGLSLVMGLSVVSIGAFLGGAAAVILVYRLATDAHGTSVTTMLLAGIAITALAGSFGSFMEFIADNEMLRRISYWKMGGLDGASYPRVAIAGAIGLPVVLLLPRYAVALNSMLLGESEARHLGIAVNRVKRMLVLLVAAAVGVSVALAGTISFIGLIVPHIMRLIIGPDHRVLLPASALAGAIFLPLADTLARVVIAPTEVPVGMVTAVLGAPFFLFLLRQGRQRG